MEKMVGIGFFAPFPLALMIPFMAGQSLAMGEAFGKGFQYGKRKISSMSNEEFNALDFKELSESLATDYRVMIPSLQKSIEASDELQKSVFRAFGDIIGTIPEIVKEFMSPSTTVSTSASALGDEISQVRFTPSHDREGDLEKTNAALAAAQKALEDAYAFAASKVNKRTTPSKSVAQQIEERAEAERKQRVLESAAKQRATEAQRAREKAPLQNKRKAGQSQRLELTKIQKAMKQLSLQIVGWKRSLTNNPSKRHLTATISNANNIMRKHQLAIERLMSNYIF